MMDQVTLDRIQGLFRHHKILFLMIDNGGAEFGFCLRDGLVIKERCLIPEDRVNFTFDRGTDREMLAGMEMQINVLKSGGKRPESKKENDMADIRRLHIGQQVIHRMRNKDTGYYETRPAEVSGLRYAKDSRPLVRLRHLLSFPAPDPETGKSAMETEAKAKWWPAPMVYGSMDEYQRLRGGEIDETITRLQEEKAGL